MTAPKVIVHPEAKVLAEVVAEGLIGRLNAAQTARGTASVVLTGGRIAAQVYALIGQSPLRDTVDWSKVDFWWGDERFLPSGDPERNETQAWESFLAVLPIDPARVHRMPAAEGVFDGDADGDADLAAADYATALATASASADGTVPHFDVVLLGVGEDGHVASMFPGNPVVDSTRTVSAVFNSPKPPPVRITLTLPTINTGDEVWLIASGAGKAEAVGRAFTAGVTVDEIPASGVHGRALTVWHLDTESAAHLPTP